jgi:hypothetical protein
MSWWQHGDEWRWELVAGTDQHSIMVIEPAETPDLPTNARRVPFGFGRVLEPDPVELEPLVWEGED